MQKPKMHLALYTYFLLSLLLLNCISTFAVNQPPPNTVHDTTKWILQADTAMAANDSLNASRSYYNLGRWFEHNQLRTRAYYYLHKSLDILTAMKHGRGMGVTSNYIAAMLSEEGRHNEAMKMYRESIVFFDKYGGEDLIPGAMVNIANEYLVLGENDSALQFAYNALDIRLTSQDSNQLGYYYWQIGSIYEITGDTLRWYDNLQKSYSLKNIPICFRADGLQNLYNDMGWYALCQKHYTQSLAYYDTLYQLGIENNNQGAISNALTSKANVYSRLGKYENALPLLLEIREMEVHKVLQNKLAHNNEIANLYLKINEPEKAIPYLNENIESAGSSFPVKREITYMLLYRAFKKQGLMADALFWHEKYIALNDSLTNEKEKNTLQELTIQYETEKKEQQIELLTTENRLKNQRINVGIAIVAFLLIVISLILYILNIRKKQATLKQTDLQQQVLRTQMNPHFIFNVLGSIQNFMMQNDTRKASNFLSQFASLTRATLNNSVAETISLADEITMLKNYIELEKMRSKDKFDFEINYDDDLEVDFIQIPPMLIQPFVENSIKHGFKTLNKNGLLKLNITDKTDWVEFVVEDNGQGFQKNAKKDKDHKSMAMLIFEKRRKLIQQKYNKDFKFTIINLIDINPETTGVKISINIPILNND
jgi:tetratricopeptide (TPR) repeat protein